MVGYKRLGGKMGTHIFLTSLSCDTYPGREPKLNTTYDDFLPFWCWGLKPGSCAFKANTPALSCTPRLWGDLL